MVGMRLRPHAAALAALRSDDSAIEAVPFSRESAIRFLTSFTGEGFGDDADAWDEWFRQNASEAYLAERYKILDEASRRRKPLTD